MKPGGRREISLERVAIWIGLACVAVFVVWFVAHLHEFVIGPHRNSDIASSLPLAEYFGDKGLGALVLGNYPWLAGQLPLHWTRWVPDHLVFWKAAPYVIYAAAVLLAGGGLRNPRLIRTRGGLYTPGPAVHAPPEA